MSIKDDRKRASKEKLKRKNAPSRDIPESTIRDPRIQIVIDFMKANLHRKISLTDLAREVNLSAAHVSRLFSIETGIPPSEYLIRLRMEKARSLLTSGLLSVKEIMNDGLWQPGPLLAAFQKVLWPDALRIQEAGFQVLAGQTPRHMFEYRNE